MNVGLSSQLVRILRLGILALRGESNRTFRKREVVRTEPNLPALLHVVDAPDVLGEVGAGSVGVVALVLRDWKTYIWILTMTGS